nr:MAG TPA: hypothetical protein [Caudoviricetes sp.]
MYRRNTVPFHFTSLKFLYSIIPKSLAFVNILWYN